MTLLTRRRAVGALSVALVALSLPGCSALGGQDPAQVSVSATVTPTATPGERGEQEQEVAGEPGSTSPVALRDGLSAPTGSRVIGEVSSIGDDRGWTVALSWSKDSGVGPTSALRAVTEQAGSAWQFRGGNARAIGVNEAAGLEAVVDVVSDPATAGTYARINVSPAPEAPAGEEPGTEQDDSPESSTP